MRFDKKDKQKTFKFADTIHASVQRDFQRPNYTQSKKQETEETPQVGAVRRITFVTQTSAYYQYKGYLIGKAVRIINPGLVCGWECQFVYDADRVALNNAAGWSDAKNTYLLDGVKFK